MSSDANVADATRSTFCDPITGLVACYEFEGSAKDGSGNGLDATTTNVTFAPGQVGQAMLVAANSSATVSANVVFDDVSRLTVEAWIQPSALPGSSSRSDILFVIGEYALFINSNGTFTCNIQGPGEAMTTTTVPVAQWTHVACTYDGVAANVYIDGSVAGTRNTSAAIANGPNGMGIAGGSPSGFQLVGLIDQLRLFNVARSAAEICADAGKTSCP